MAWRDALLRAEVWGEFAEHARWSEEDREERLEERSAGIAEAGRERALMSLRWRRASPSGRERHNAYVRSWKRRRWGQRKHWRCRCTHAQRHFGFWHRREA